MIYFFPVIAAVLWALCYACFEESLHNLPVASWYLVAGLFSVALSFLIPAFGGEAIDLRPVLNWKVGLVFVVALVAGRAADLLSTYAIRDISATYTGLVEIAYPLFIPVFALLLFGNNQFSWHLFVGGALVIGGLYVVMAGQIGADRKQVATAQEEVRHVSLEGVPPRGIELVQILAEDQVSGRDQEKT